MSCSFEKHRLHICALQSPENAELLRELKRDATVECARCGAIAKNPDNLCSPRPLPAVPKK